MNEAIVWLEEGFQETYQYAMSKSERYGDVWILDRGDTDYTTLCHPIIYLNVNNAFYSIKEDS